MSSTTSQDREENPNQDAHQASTAPSLGLSTNTLTQSSIPHIAVAMSRCFLPLPGRALSQIRMLHSAVRSCAPLSVARLLETTPADPDNVMINGFIRSIRSQKKWTFASIGDGSSLEPLQALLTPEQAQRYLLCSRFPNQILTRLTDCTRAQQFALPVHGDPLQTLQHKATSYMSRW